MYCCRTLLVTKALNIKLVSHRRPRSGKTWFLVGLFLLDEERVDAAVRESHEETGLSLTFDYDLTLLSNNPVRDSLP
jgi:8-oxo-dGTP pyrophosphatase MutT (NUDIX family)